MTQGRFLIGPEDENMYPYNCIQIYFHSSDIVNRIEFKENKHIWIENMCIKITLNMISWGNIHPIKKKLRSEGRKIGHFTPKRNVVYYRDMNIIWSVQSSRKVLRTLHALNRPNVVHIPIICTCPRFKFSQVSEPGPSLPSYWLRHFSSLALSGI